MDNQPQPPSVPSAGAVTTRRAVLAGAGATAVALGATACTGTAGRTAAPLSTTVRTDGATVLTTTDQVPVGGAVAAGAVIVTQPHAGTYEAFDAACPHRGCAVTVQGDLLICPCHDSRFSLTGALEQGPADRDLTAVPITVDGTEIVAS